MKHTDLLKRNLVEKYKKRKSDIQKRLNEFRKTYKRKDEDIFAELCFCLFTPGSKAVCCDRALKILMKENLLFKGSPRSISSRIRGLVRFHNNKAGYLACAREALKENGRLNIRAKINTQDMLATREWLVKNIKGLGYKESSHFLRNIGLGKDIAILDRHILKHLKQYGVIDNIPASINRKQYLLIEDKMRVFSKSVNIPLDELDLLFWSNETGFIFK